MQLRQSAPGVAHPLPRRSGAAGCWSWRAPPPARGLPRRACLACALSARPPALGGGAWWPRECARASGCAGPGVVVPARVRCGGRACRAAGPGVVVPARVRCGGYIARRFVSGPIGPSRPIGRSTTPQPPASGGYAGQCGAARVATGANRRAPAARLVVRVTLHLVGWLSRPVVFAQRAAQISTLSLDSHPTSRTRSS